MTVPVTCYNFRFILTECHTEPKCDVRVQISEKEMKNTTNGYQFSRREKDVVHLLLQGKSNKQIAFNLDISNRTVEFHLGNIYAKLEVTSRAEAILKLTENHLRESTGDPSDGIPVKPTVAKSSASTENGIKSILRRIVMNKMLYATGGIVLVITAIVAMIMTNPSIRRQAPVPIELTSTQAITETPTISPALPTATFPVPAESPQPTNVVLPSHTVNGYTAAIESYYVDVSHIVFQIRVTGGEITFGNEHFYDRIGIPDLYDENGNLINASVGVGPAIDPTLIQFEFVPVTLLKEDRLKGQVVFDIKNTSDYNQSLAHFRFDFDLPVFPSLIFNPKQVVTANGIEIVLDQVTVSATFTQIYLCYSYPSFGDWQIDSESVLQLENQQITPYDFRVLFDSSIGGDRRAGSEPYWVPPVKNGRCLKSGFATGSTHPTILTLVIPQLVKSAPDILLSDQLAKDYPGMSPQQAYHKYLEEHNNIVRGPWVFNVKLVP